MSLQPPHDAARFLGPAHIVQRGTECGRRMRTAMPAHQKIEIVRLLSPAAGPDAIAVWGRRKIGIGGHPGRAHLVEQEADMSRSGGTVAWREDGRAWTAGACE